MTSPSNAPGVLGADRAALPVLSFVWNTEGSKMSFVSRFCPRPLPAAELDGEPRSVQQRLWRLFLTVRNESVAVSKIYLLNIISK